MEPLCEIRTRRLLKISADIDKQMAELRALREVIQAQEATLAVPEPIDPAIVAISPPAPQLAKQTSDRESFSARHLSTAD
jgi:hypothetical protein